MSANRWTECPKCGSDGDGNEGVGLAEYAELGTLNGEFFVRFEAECRDCGYSFKFNHKERLHE